MANRMPGRCPVCGETMEITTLHCHACDTTISGHFATCKFCQLSEEMQDFVEIFIRSRGNIKEVERALGISYPTVRSRLEAVIRALGYSIEGEVEEQLEQAQPVSQASPAGQADAPAPGRDSERRREILAALSRGEITAEEAATRLRQP